MEINNKLKINEYVILCQLKRKLKAHLVDQGYSEFKTSVFAQGLIISLVMVLEELILDCLKNVTKDKTGLYTINTLILKSVLYESDKFSFCLKYLRKYNSVIKYHDSVFFNIKKVMDNLELKHGSKLMIDSESNNMICYMILGLQYDLIDLSLKMVKYANRKTLNNLVLEICCQYIMSNDFSSKIKLKLDSVNISNDDDIDEAETEIEVDDDIEAEVDAETDVETKVETKTDAETKADAEIKEETNNMSNHEISTIDNDNNLKLNLDKDVKKNSKIEKELTSDNLKNKKKSHKNN